MGERGDYDRLCGGLDLNEADMHIGLIVSESGVSTLVPEPSSLVLFGAGLLVIVGLTGRKLITA